VGRFFYFLTRLKEKNYNLALGREKEGRRERGIELRGLLRAVRSRYRAEEKCVNPYVLLAPRLRLRAEEGFILPYCLAGAAVKVEGRGGTIFYLCLAGATKLSFLFFLFPILVRERGRIA